VPGIVWGVDSGDQGALTFSKVREVLYTLQYLTHLWHNIIAIDNNSHYCLHSFGRQGRSINAASYLVHSLHTGCVSVFDAGQIPGEYWLFYASPE
jgi:hypothetical protein